MGEMFTFELSIRKNHRLVTTGPYAFVRHPSYTAATLTTFGALACHTLPGSYFMEEVSHFLSPWLVQATALGFWLTGFFLAVVLLAQRIPLEDATLRREFGSQWDEWARQVPYRLIPGIY
jgi:protein-S-isoprenylcysteine O-methyltransferase Ste14